MDEIDFTILKKLLENSRVTYRELSENIDLSISTIHKRIRKLEDNGIINAYIARPSVIALKYLWVMIFGTSKTRSLDIIREELGQHESIIGIGIAGGKFLVISETVPSPEIQNWVLKYGEVSKNNNLVIKALSGFYVAQPIFK